MKAIFRVRKFEEPTLGSYLRCGREKVNLSLAEAADRISISARHLRALENNNFSALPPEVYVKGFIKRYCHLLELDHREALHLFEKKKNSPEKDNALKSIIDYPWFCNLVSYRNVVIFAGFLLIVASLFYLLKVIYPIYAKPFFILSSPESCPFVTDQEKFELKGSIQPESKIWINDEEALVDKEGNFRCPLFLKKGENQVKFRIINKFGKERSGECKIIKN